MKAKVQKLWLLIMTGCLAPRAEPNPEDVGGRGVASVTLPLAVADATPVQVPSKYYYGIPVRPIYKSYPVYHPAKEPPGYIDISSSRSR